MSGIETVYRGYRFRSRAEARWAAFFDLLKWRWQYEPLDLCGYIPDFVVEFREPILFEVKGGVLSTDVGQSEAIRMACSKIELSGWARLAIVVGASPDFVNGVGFPRLGRFASITDGWEYSDTNACLFRCDACGNPSVNSESGSWACLRCGAHDGNRYVELMDRAELLWAEASTMTQWRAA